jgi:hypothetical protein
MELKDNSPTATTVSKIIKLSVTTSANPGRHAFMLSVTFRPTGPFLVLPECPHDQAPRLPSLGLAKRNTRSLTLCGHKFLLIISDDLGWEITAGAITQQWLFVQIIC